MEVIMKTLNRSLIALIIGLPISSLALAPIALAQTQTTQDGKTSPPVVHHNATKQRTQDGNSPTTVGPASGAYKQRTQGALPDIGPASGAYNGNVQHSKY
jgi:hypothetical protein